MAHILTLLQIHHSRLQGLKNEFTENSNTIQVSRTITSYMYSLGELQALVNRTFDFARGQKKFNGVALEYDEFISAYLGLDVLEDVEFGDLLDFTKKTVDSKTESIKL